MISRRAKRTALGCTFVLFFVAIFSVAVARYFAEREQRRRYEEEKASLKPRPEQYVTIKRESHPRLARYAVQVLPWREAKVAAEVSGRVVEMPAERGSQVEQGELLVKIDDTLARLNLRSAEAALASAQAQQRETRRLGDEADVLWKRQVLSQTEREAALARIQTTDADLERLKAERDRLAELVERHEIRAPFSGVVNDRMVDVGDTVSTNEPVISLVDLDPLRVVFFVNEEEVAALQPSDELRLTISAQPAEVHRPQVQFITRSADPATGLFRVEAVLPNPDGKIPGGVQGIAEAQLDAYKEMPFVPAAAVRFVGPKAVVEVFGNSTATREIEVGPEIDGAYPVLSGLNEGDKVLIE